MRSGRNGDGGSSGHGAGGGPNGGSTDGRGTGDSGTSGRSAGDSGTGGGSGPGRDHGETGRSAGRPPRIPPPRSAPDDAPPLVGLPGNTGSAEAIASPAAESHPARPALYDHKVLKSLLGAWALSACSGEETAAVETHLTDCAPCADEAVRLREAVGLLQKDDSLDLDPLLRSRVLEGCLGRRPARIPVPEWAAPYDAETARLDALLRDMGEAEWRAPVRLKWFDGERGLARDVTVAGVIGHLMSVDGLVASALGLADPLGDAVPLGAPSSPTARTEAFWRMESAVPAGAIREPWRDQGHTLIRTVSFAGRGVAELGVSYGDSELPLRDSFLDRAFECWMHAGDIAEAVDYPYEPPASAHLHRMIDLAVRLLPTALARRRRAGLAGPPRRLVAAGSPGRTLHLEIEGSGGGNWHIALDSPAAVGSPDHVVAHIALDAAEFCQLAAGHVPPDEAAAGHEGDREAIRDVLGATASLSRL
ncbi:maleylpyruvate isomerase N-terminal domain-containing protein [Streptomyces sp. URMC 123]|uniref:maleylpyruvate isomerase N-terminal domain-containing protein n=1 Tax=Streptomyces sp. URMC 123 TaxID=3423403 RepID=UPI003F1D09BC